MTALFDDKTTNSWFYEKSKDRLSALWSVTKNKSNWKRIEGVYDNVKTQSIL